MLIDAHSHRKKPHLQILVGRDTFGIHPWDLGLPFDRQAFVANWPQENSLSTDILAIGECGLDRVREQIASMDDQLFVLKLHFELAKKLERPIIIHCVRAFSDLLYLLKKTNYKGKFLLHDFNGNEEEIRKLLKYDAYFSCGSAAMKNPQKKISIPRDRLLLETGDQEDWTLEELYQRVSDKTQMTLKVLEAQVEKNFLTFFNQLDDIGAANFIDNLHRRSRTN